MSAKNTGSGIVITVSDDGRGISQAKVVEAARRHGADMSHGHAPTNEELLSMIMLPGVTTRSSVDEESGRGVGLDAVREAIEKMKGSITLATEEGKGTSFFIHIPQTLAIMNCIALEASGTVFMVPAPDIYKMVKPDNKNLIEYPDGSSKILFQGYTVPLLRLDRLMKMERSKKEFERGIIVMIEGESSAAAVYADKLMGQAKVVIKPLPQLLRRLNFDKTGVSGCTIRGDGSVCLIIDADTVLAIARRAGE